MAGRMTGGVTMRLVGLSALLLLAGVAPASASAGFWCESDDENVAFSIEGGLSRGVPGPPFGIKGSLTVKLKTAPQDFRELTIKPRDLVQSWFDSDEIRLQIYRERPKGLFAAIDLAISTTIDADDETTFNGTYTLNLEEMMSKGASQPAVSTVSGTTSCSAG